jgi:hypothetical protein
VSAEVVVVVEDENPRGTARAGAEELRGGQTADPAANDDEVVALAGVGRLAPFSPERAVPKLMRGRVRRVVAAAEAEERGRVQRALRQAAHFRQPRGGEAGRADGGAVQKVAPRDVVHGARHCTLRDVAHIDSGQVVAFFLFDVAESIRLEELRSLVGLGTKSTRFTTKVAAPAYVQYQTPPVVVSGEALGMKTIRGFKSAFKIYEYGVLSVALTLDFRGTWGELDTLAHSLTESDLVESAAEAACAKLVERIKGSIVQLRPKYLSEDYFVFGVTRLNRSMGARDLLESHGADIARLVRGERKPLSIDETNEVLRHRLSYLADDLIVPTWSAAFVYDADGIEPALEIIEFANSQLLQFRYYDDLLDDELTRIYPVIQRRRWNDTLMGGRYSRAARQLHSLFIDVNEITDRTENALKIVGEVYAARLFNLLATRLGLDAWKQAVKEKLKTLDDIYRFTVEQVNMTRGHLLEGTIIAILLFELWLFFAGIMK